MTTWRRCTQRPATAWLLALGLLSGCQSARSWQDCPGIYSGVRYFRDQARELPVDGKIAFSLDLPLTVVADTLALPFTSFAERKPPVAGYPVGCRWAADR